MTERELFELLREAKTPLEFDPKKNDFYGLEGAIKIELSNLADFINDYFLPRPLFEDGTPVKVGEMFVLHGEANEEITDFCVCDDGSFSINHFCYDQDQRVMKPKQPEALDADGVPIKAGDKIYLVGADGTPLKCVGFHPDGDIIFMDWEETGTIAYENPTVFTHKKPDSWEQLEEDKKKCIQEYWGCQDDGEKLCCECEHSLLKTGSSCATNKYKDLFRRAKALAGVKDE